ncbi:MAG: TrkH family potassium uptake protein [Pseudomonadota bacterium]|nr:TrkH family potassium uptake protein [Pseudomonadota bacterium]
MALRAVLSLFGWLTVLFALAMLLPAVVGLLDGEAETPEIFAVSAVLGLAAGSVVIAVSPRERRRRTGRREAFLLAVLTWTALPVFGALPLSLVAGPLDAWLEAMSAFTTTGYSVFDRPEELPRSLLLWRALMQWMGGLATIILAVVMLGVYGLGGLAVYRSAIPAGDSATLAGRLRETASAIWWVYAIMTLVCALLLWVTGVDPFDAVCFGMSTISTGGFANSSAGASDLSPAARAVLMIFMLGGALNFTLHWATFHGRFDLYLRDPETRVLLAIVAAGTILVALPVWGEGTSPLAAVSEALFAVVSVISTTGHVGLPVQDGLFAVAWPTSASLVLLILMMIGGAAGSTAGGFKLMRFELLLRQGGVEMNRLPYPNGVSTVKFGGVRVPAEALRATWGFLMLFIVSVALVAGLIGMDGHDLATALALSVGALSNAGAGADYVIAGMLPIADLDPFAKIAIVGGMLAGRLELLALLGVFMPSFWKH